MFLHRLSIYNFRNIRRSDLTFAKHINCFIGKNGVGKTNIIDSIYYLSFSKSPSNREDKDNITFGETGFQLKAHYHRADSEFEISCALDKGRKMLKRDGKEYEKVSDHIGLIPAILVAPKDIDIIQGASEERRKFIDGCISQFDRKYLDALLVYKNALRGRNALLTSSTYVDPIIFESYEDKLASAGMFLYNARKEFVETFKSKVDEVYRKISYDAEEGEGVDIEYKSQATEADYLTMLRTLRGEDQRRGFSTWGVHRDDYNFKRTGRKIKKIASQGEMKTMLLALKFAWIDMFVAKSDVKPILLLDDIFDKLDEHRMARIIDFISDSQRTGQVFISDTNREHITLLLEKTENIAYTVYEINESDGMSEDKAVKIMEK